MKRGASGDTTGSHRRGGATSTGGRGWAALLAVGLWSACGPRIEEEPQPEPNPTPPECAPNDPDCVPPASTSLWPVTSGSSWVYEVEDPVLGRFEKVVRVVGRERVPGTDREAVVLLSEQPELLERSWQIEERGLVKRVRDEEAKRGARPRVATWSPALLESLATPQRAGWESRVQVQETLTENGEATRNEQLFLWRVVQTEVPMTVGDQQVRAVQLRSERPGGDGAARTYWLVPGIGKVREEGARTEVLKSYTIGR